MEDKKTEWGIARREADSTLRCGMTKQRKRQQQKREQATARANAGNSFPSAPLRVRMTILEIGSGVEEKDAVAHDLFFTVGVA